MLLNLETSTNICSVAVSDGESIIAFRETNEGFSHAEKLTVFIAEVLEESKIKLKDLDAVAVSSGPGSYTGLRIGISVAKGLCFAVDKQLISIPTLQAMASGSLEKLVNVDSNILLCPMIDARRMEVYCALYDSNLNCHQAAIAKVVTSELFSEINDFKKIYFFGDGAEKCRLILNPLFEYLPDVFPSAKKMAKLANKKWKNGQFENLALFEPFYLKEYKAGKKSE